MNIKNWIFDKLCGNKFVYDVDIFETLHGQIARLTKELESVRDDRDRKLSNIRRLECQLQSMESNRDGWRLWFWVAWAFSIIFSALVILSR